MFTQKALTRLGHAPCRRGLVVLTVFAATLFLGAQGQTAEAGLSVFNPDNADHLKKDASHFNSGAAHLTDWKEWWYFNFHAPDVENGKQWDGIVVFHTKGDLGSGAPGDKVRVVVGIWADGALRWAADVPLAMLGDDMSGYSSSTTKCDVSVKTAVSDNSTAKYDAAKDEYKIHVVNAAGNMLIDLTYTRITKGFLPDMNGFPNGGWRELYWAVPMPYADVSGTITLPIYGQKNITDATGYHDHNWGFWADVDAAWDWGECPIPGSNATVIFGKVSGDNNPPNNYGTAGVVVAVDANGIVAWGEHPDIDVTYKGAWGSDAVGRSYPQIDHIYAKGGGKIIDIESQVVHYLFPSQLGWIVEIMAGYAGKVYSSGSPDNPDLTLAANTSRGFLEYKDSNGEGDQAAPGAPTNVVVTAPVNNCTQLDVSWTAPAGEAATGYNVYRSGQVGGPYHYRGTAKGVPNYRDGPCAAGTQYFYKVTAYDGVPNEGALSASGNGTTNTGCPEICDWPRADEFWHGIHSPFDTVYGGTLTFNGTVIVGNLGSTPVFDAYVEAHYGTPSSGVGLNSSSLSYAGSEEISYIPPYGQVPTGLFTFTTPPTGNEFGQPYWMVRATVEAPTGQFSTGMPWDDPNVSVLNRWERSAQAGDPLELDFWMENSTPDAVQMTLDLDLADCPAGWTVTVDPDVGAKVPMSPGQLLPALLTVVPTGGTTGSVHIVQSQYTLDGDFVRLSGGLTLTLTATPLGDTNGDELIDLTDYLDFAACLAGPSVSPPSGRCQAVFDFNGNEDVDLGDFAGFQLAFTGS